MTTVNTNKTFTVVSKALEDCLTNYSQLKLPTESLSHNAKQMWDKQTHTHSCIHRVTKALSRTQQECNEELQHL